MVDPSSRLYGELVEHVKADRTLVLVGTGVSLSATGGASTAGWTGLIKDGLQYCAELDRSLPPDWAQSRARELDAAAMRGDLVEVISIATNLERRLGGATRTDGNWRSWLRKTIGQLTPKDRSAVDALHTLGRGRLATCNYDDILTSPDYPAVPWTRTSDVIRVLNREEGGVIHLHGHWKAPESVVLGYSSYEDVLRNAPAQTIQQAIAALSSIVFVGFGAGLEDPNFGALLEWMASNFKGREAHHFRLVRDGDAPMKMPTGARIAEVPYGPTYGDLPAFLWRLVADAGLDGRADRSVEPEVPAPRPSDAMVSPSPVYNVRYRAVPEFLGRDEDMKRLDAALKKGGPVAVSASLEGLPGVGKTELALQMVARLSEEGRFPGGIVWLDAENPELMSTWGGVIADALDVDAGLVPERAKAAMRKVEKGGPALLVLDNVVSWVGSEKPAPLPTGGHVSLLVTTRQRALGGRQAFQHLSIECLAPEAAERLLRVIAGRDLGDARDVADLIAHLGGHTLAVELAGAFLFETPECTPRQYLARLQAGEKLGDEVTSKVRYELTVDQALAAIWERLDEGARSAWLVLGEMAHADATLALLEACGVGERARRVLRGYHLLTDDNGQRWGMHRLVRDFGARVGTEEERATARRRFVDGGVARAELVDVATGYRIYVDEGAHLEKAIAVVGTDPAFAMRVHSFLLDRLGTAAQSAGDFARAKDLLEQALASDLKNLGEDHSKVAIRRSNLAAVLKDLGDLARAKDLLEQALASDLKNLGEDHPEVATCRNNLATVLHGLGDLARAKELHEQALASDLKNLGEDHPKVATWRSNLATVLQDLGDLARAKELLEQALAFDLKTLGEDHPSVARCRSNLAMVLKDLGDLARAKDLLEQALASALKTFGEDHPNVSICRSNLAAVLKGLGDLARAKDLLEQALASNLKTLGEDHPSVARCRSNLALVLKALGDLARAKELLEQALASNLKNLGEDHPFVAISRFKLAGHAEQAEQLEEAHGLFAQALASEERSLGPSHPSTAHTRARLARVLHTLGRGAEARSHATRALRDVAALPPATQARVAVETALGGWFKDDGKGDPGHTPST